MIAAAEGVTFDTPFGPVTFRAIDHQSTHGRLRRQDGVKDGKGVMVDSVYHKGADYLPPDDEVKKLRPQN